MGAAAIAVGSALPGLPGFLTEAEGEAPVADDAAMSAVPGTPTMAQPLIAHITDLQSGEMSLYMGEREFTVNDPGLASRLFRAAK